MISKELLSEVLKIEIIEILGIDKKNDLVYRIMQEYKNNDGYESKSIGTYINIYKLAHKCKEWANKQGYWANSGYDNKYYCMLRDMPDNQWFYADTEVEAIFKACEWILKEIKDK